MSFGHKHRTFARRCASTQPFLHRTLCGVSSLEVGANSNATSVMALLHCSQEGIQGPSPLKKLTLEQSKFGNSRIPVCWWFLGFGLLRFLGSVRFSLFRFWVHPWVSIYRFCELRWGCAWRSRFLFAAIHPRGRPRRPPRSELQAAEGQRRRQGPTATPAFSVGPPRETRIAGQIRPLRLPNPQCRRPGTPR